MSRLVSLVAVTDLTTFGCWPRQAGPALVLLLDKLHWHILRARWAEAGIPCRLTVALKSTGRVRYVQKQAGAEQG